jgi:hypothetical protein
MTTSMFFDVLILASASINLFLMLRKGANALSNPSSPIRLWVILLAAVCAVVGLLDLLNIVGRLAVRLSILLCTLSLNCALLIRERVGPE